MGGSGRGDASIQAFFPLTPQSSPTKAAAASSSTPTSDTLIGDGFTSEEIEDALKPKPVQPWQPQVEYLECDIRDLYPGPRAVTFMGRIANIFDVANTPKTPRSAKGCIKLCIKNDTGAITVRLWFAQRLPAVRLGSLVSIWTNHISSAESGNLASTSAPLFASLFPERDRTCHLMLHQNSDDGTLCKRPLGFRERQPLAGLMTLDNFVNGGYDVLDARILVVVKSIGAKKRVNRKDGSTTENVNLQVQDDTAEATLGLWGTAALSPCATASEDELALSTNPDAISAKQGWKPGETILLLEAPGWKLGRTTYLSMTSTTITDVDPGIPDADWLRRWSMRQKSREAINPPFPEGVFSLRVIKYGPVRCLFTISDLDEFARAAPSEVFQGYLSLLITETKLLDYWKRQMLLSGECCGIANCANAISGKCKGCDKDVPLRLNPRIVGQMLDETGVIAPGKLLFSDNAWEDLLGRDAEDLLKLGYEEIKYLSDRLLFCRITAMFGWSGDESKAGGRVCVLAVRS